MQLTPRYGDRPIVRAEPETADPATPLLRQQARLAATLGSLDADQWASPSRCEGWSVQDVIAHLLTADQFWAYSINAGLGGEPTTFLRTFDPVASPAEMVAAARSATPDETLAQFVDSVDALAAAIARVDGAWSTIAEAPPGHVSVSMVAAHALWDSWIHERDIALPLGLSPVTEPDEVTVALGYAAALSPTFLASLGSTRLGSIDVQVTDPDVRVFIEVGPQVVIRDGGAPEGAVVITGDAVEVLEALSLRGPFPVPPPEEGRWMLEGLAQVFDAAV
jgi:uncharacterized protein (TIGR03083 family)